MLFHVSNFDDVNSPKDVDQLDLEQLKSILSSSPGSLTAPSLFKFREEDFQLGDDSFSDENLIYTYIQLCRMQQQLCQYLMNYTTQGCSHYDDNAMSLKELFNKMDHVSHVVGEIRSRLIELVNSLIQQKQSKRTLEKQAEQKVSDPSLPSRPMNVDAWGVPVDFEPHQMSTVKDIVVGQVSMKNEYGLHPKCKPPIGLIPPAHAYKSDPKNLSPNKLVERIQDITQKICEYSIRGFELPDYSDTAACEDWIEELHELANVRRESKKESFDRAVSTIESIYTLFPAMFTSQECKQLSEIANIPKPKKRK